VKAGTQRVVLPGRSDPIRIVPLHVWRKTARSLEGTALAAPPHLSLPRHLTARLTAHPLAALHGVRQNIAYLGGDPEGLILGGQAFFVNLETEKYSPSLWPRRSAPISVATVPSGSWGLWWRGRGAVSTEITQIDVIAAYCADQNNSLALGCNGDTFDVTGFGDALTAVNVDWDVDISSLDEHARCLRGTRTS
jgi:hypothetical protein